MTLGEFLSLAAVPLVLCLAITAIHGWYGIRVLKRGVIFIDIALAQTAALGAALGVLWGWEPGSAKSYALSVLFTLVVALFLAKVRTPFLESGKEALIGIIYVICGSAMVVLFSYLPDGDEHIKVFLTGQILFAGLGDVWASVLLYGAIGVFWFFFLRSGPGKRAAAGKRDTAMRDWGFFQEFLFYSTFGLVVTLSVKSAGVLLVFCYLVIPPFAGFLFLTRERSILFFSWAFGALASLIGIGISFWVDVPTGACIALTMGGMLLLAGFGRMVAGRA